MQIKLTLTSTQSYIQLPIHYNGLIQAGIYHTLDPSFAEFLHDHAYQIDNRRFPLFSFSRLYGKYEINKEVGHIRFFGPVTLKITSPVKEFIDGMGKLFLQNGFRIGNQILNVDGMEMKVPEVKGESTVVKTLSPIVTYSTLYHADWKKYTLYHHPKDKDFSQIVMNNLLRKARILFGEEVEFGNFQIQPIGDYFKQSIVVFKNTVIKGYSGKFKLIGDTRLLKTALDAALGSKNALGFGMVDNI
ncbi:MAG TPA: CRISPR-associated endoribonuclease Cas6 [Paenibacillaceae bacterium]|nr:CRISPR-associated endoribonuclease Cas6 [Paenibacillaceae bacterium]